MSTVSVLRPATAYRRPPSPWSTPAAVSLGCALVLAMTAGKAAAVWNTGVFHNPDDAMRAVEVRDLLAGQGWFDLVQHRMAPGHGVPLHWSRLADLPVAALVLAFRAVLHADTAEVAARLVEPALLLAGFMLCMARLGRALLGPPGPLAACLLAACGLDTAGAFIPGHIHHHGLQVTLLAALAVCVVEGIGGEGRRARRFAAAGAVAALTLAINLQNLPFVLVAVAILGAAWIVDGAPVVAALRGFAAALMASTAVLFLVQVPPERYALPTCDAFGAPHLLAAWLGGAGLLALRAASPTLRRPSARLAAAALVALVVVLALRATVPGCLGDPYADVDPLLRTRWLAEVGEAMPLAELLRRDPAGDLSLLIALALGLAATGYAVLRSSGPARWRWTAVAGFALAGAAGTAWEVRVAASAEPFWALGAGWALCSLFGPTQPPRRMATLLCMTCGLALTQAGWAAVVPPVWSALRPVPASAGPAIDAAACFAPAAYAPLAALPPGLVLSTIDPGSQILAYTHHSVLAAPYHRNSFGNLAALRFFDAPAEDAHALAAAAGARYVAVCATSPEVVEDAVRAPGGVAAAVLRGAPPSWLRPVDTGAGPVRVFELAPWRSTALSSSP